MINDFIAFTDASKLFRQDQLKWEQLACVSATQKEEIHIWKIELDTDDHTLNEFQTFLSADEHDRAEKFQFEIDRKHFVVRKGAQRVILARYFNIEPKKLQFRYTEEGKPFLEKL